MAGYRLASAAASAMAARIDEGTGPDSSLLDRMTAPGTLRPAM